MLHSIPTQEKMEYDGELLEEQRKRRRVAQQAQQARLAARQAQEQLRQARENTLFTRVEACIEKGPMSLGFGGFDLVIAGVRNNLVRGADLEEGVVAVFRDGIVCVNQEQFNELVNMVNLWQEHKQ